MGLPCQRQLHSCHQNRPQPRMATRVPLKLVPRRSSIGGGKTRIVDKILELMPPHAMFVEPFCGSAQVFFKRNPLDKRWEPPGPYDPDYRGGVSEVLNDLDGRVINFF